MSSSRINNKGKILKTNDNVLDRNNFSKPGRRVVVTDDDGVNIKVNKITKNKDYVLTSTYEERRNQRNRTTPINYRNYPRSLSKESVVDKKQYKTNMRTGNKLKITDPELEATGEKLTLRDMSKVNKLINK